ncbi:MAG: YegP family protein [Nitrosomonas sp.]|nr:YegP family protein [Nitrosomonas sp.]
MSYELNKSSNNKFFFNLKAGNGQTILNSEMYESKASALSGINSVQTNCANADRYTKSTSSNGKHYFTLKAGNHQIIGNSQMYESSNSCDDGIKSVMSNGISTTIKDNT